MSNKIGNDRIDELERELAEANDKLQVRCVDCLREREDRAEAHEKLAASESYARAVSDAASNLTNAWDREHTDPKTFQHFIDALREALGKKPSTGEGSGAELTATRSGATGGVTVRLGDPAGSGAESAPTHSGAVNAVGLRSDGPEA